MFGTVRAGDSLPYVPTHQGNLTLALGHVYWDIAATATYVGAQRDLPGQDIITADANRFIPAYTVLDIAVQAYPTDRLTVYVQGKNILNTAYATSLRPYGLRPGQPLYVESGLKVTF